MCSSIVKIKEIIIVEGKYDAMAVKRSCDATVIETNGFGIFKNKQTASFIAKSAKERGIIILTDSDRAGFVIRRYLESSIEKKYIKNAYIPAIQGKERRKKIASKEGSLGVEGMNSDIILKALQRAGATESKNSTGRLITKADLYEDGLCGRENSVAKKRALLKKLDLPENLSTTKFLEAANVFLGYEVYKKMIDSEDK